MGTWARLTALLAVGTAPLKVEGPMVDAVPVCCDEFKSSLGYKRREQEMQALATEEQPDTNPLYSELPTPAARPAARASGEQN